MLDMFTANSTAGILLFVIGAITVFYILTDGSKSNQNEKEYTDETRKNEPESPKEEVAQPKQEVQHVERKQAVGQATVNSDITEQGLEYQPTNTAPLPKLNTVAVETPTQPATPTPVPVNYNNGADEVKGNLTLEDFNDEDGDEVDVVCQWCDNVVKMRKGGSMVCPRCSGTIES